MITSEKFLSRTGTYAATIEPAAFVGMKRSYQVTLEYETRRRHTTRIVFVTGKVAARKAARKWTDK